MGGSFRLLRIAGIDINVNYTLFFAIILIAWSLVDGFFPQTWSTTTLWTAGIISALLLFVSVLIHELAHSLVSKSKGIGVRSITLFIFGGVSNLEDEPTSARTEFIIAIVGPVASVILAGIFWVLQKTVGHNGTPASEILYYLALINVMLAAFNILPGFPLDGGRVLRSIIWGTTRSFDKATKAATIVGQILGAAFIALGVILIFATENFFNGLWIAFIGWFLISAAGASRRQSAIRSNSTGVLLVNVMNTTPEYVSPGISVADVLREYFVRRGLNAVLVCQWDKLVGIATITDIKNLPEERWPYTPAQEIMTRAPLHTITKDADLTMAINMLNQYGINQLPVVEDEKLVGLITRNSIISYLQLKNELSVKTDRSSSVRLTRTVLVVLGTATGYSSFLVSQPWLSFGLLLLGLVLSVYGCYLWARLKGRYWTWMFFGLLSPIGLLVLAILKPKPEQASSISTTTRTT